MSASRLPSPQLAAALAFIRELDNQKPDVTLVEVPPKVPPESKTNPIDWDCLHPECGAKAGQSCRLKRPPSSGKGHKSAEHTSRREKAAFARQFPWALQEACETCGVPSGEPCRRRNGLPAATPHQARVMDREM